MWHTKPVQLGTTLLNMILKNKKTNKLGVCVIVSMSHMGQAIIVQVIKAIKNIRKCKKAK